METFKYGKRVVQVLDGQANQAKTNKIQNLVDKNRAAVLIGQQILQENKEEHDYADPTSSQQQFI